MEELEVWKRRCGGGGGMVEEVEVEEVEVEVWLPGVGG